MLSIIVIDPLTGKPPFEIALDWNDAHTMRHVMKEYERLVDRNNELAEELAELKKDYSVLKADHH